VHRLNDITTAAVYPRAASRLFADFQDQGIHPIEGFRSWWSSTSLRWKGWYGRESARSFCWRGLSYRKFSAGVDP
jgi:hypothetical protein